MRAPAAAAAPREASRPPMDAPNYFSLHQSRFFEAIRERLGKASLPNPHTRLVWANNSATLVAAFEEEYRALFGSMNVGKKLPELLYPVDPYETIDRHRSLTSGQPGERLDGKLPEGSVEWSPVAGQAIAVEFEAAFRQSLPRMGLRFVALADDSNGFSTVASDTLVASHPVDRLVARLLCDPKVIRYVRDPQAAGKQSKRTDKRADKDTSRPEAFADGIKLVNLDFQGEHDRRLWNYARFDPPDARAEDIAQQIWDRGDGKLHTEYAYGLVVVPPFVIIPPRWAKDIPQCAAYAPEQVDEAAAVSALDLADSALGDEAARMQAGKPAGKVDRGTLAKALVRAKGQLGLIADLIGPWNLFHQVGPALRWVTKHQESIDAAPDQTLGVWAAIASGLDDTLAEATGDIIEVVELAQARGVRPSEAGAKPFRDVIEPLATAMGVSHLKQHARAQLAIGKQRKAQLPLVLLENSLRSTRDSADELAATGAPSSRPKDAASVARGSTQTLEAGAVDMRAKMIAGADTDPEQLEALTVAAAEEALANRLMAVDSRTEQLLAAMRQVAAPGDPDLFYRFPRRLREIQATSRSMLETMRVLEHPRSIPADPKQAQKAYAEARKGAVANTQRWLAELEHREGIRELFEQAVQKIEDARIRQMIADIALLIGISIAGAMAGAWVGGFVRGSVLSVAVADTAVFMQNAARARALGAAANIATDAGTSAVLQTTAFGGNTKLTFVENVMANVMTLGALRPIQRYGEILGKLDSDAVGMWKVVSRGRVAFVHAGTFTTEMLVGASAGYIASRVAHGEQPKDEHQATAWAMQGAAMAVGHFISRRMGQLQQRLGQLKELGVHLETRARRQSELAARLSQEKTPNTEDALLLLEEHSRLLEDEAALLKDEKAVARLGLDAQQLATLRAGNEVALHETDSQAYDTMKLRFHGLEPLTNNGSTWAGSRESIQRVVAEAGVAVKSVQEDRTPRYWETEMAGRAVRLVEIDATDLRLPHARGTGVAGPDLHTHVMGVTDVQYFVDKIGSGKASEAFEAVYKTLASNAAVQKKAAHGWAIAQATHADIEHLKTSGAKQEKIEARARQGMTEMLAAGPATPFDSTYPVREAVVSEHIDPGGGPFRNYTRDTMKALAEEGVGYSEQSVGLGKLERKFPEQMMKELHGELGKQGKDVDMRFLAMVTTKALGGKIDSAEAESTIAQLDQVLARGDVIGIDFAGPEKQAFTVDGMENFKKLYGVVSAASEKRKRPLVVRPHVGEGYNEGGGQAHAEVARKNLEMLITTLESIGYNPSKAAKDGVIVRFGHATHATAEQIERIAKLGVIVEANIGSNEITNSVAKADDHPLLYNLYYRVKTVAGTDAQGVMQTDRRREYARARQHIERFRNNEFALELADGKRVHFRDLSRKEQDRFSLDTLEKQEDAYHATVVAGDRNDAARRH
jgi:hypothetical protein